MVTWQKSVYEKINRRVKSGPSNTTVQRGNQASPNNYRPVSVLPVFSKIYEKVNYIDDMKFLKIEWF